MRIKHGNKVMREQQSELREKVRWGRIQLEEANEEIARLKQSLRDAETRITKRNTQISTLRAHNRKLRGMMNDVIQEELFKFALEFAVTKHRTNFIEHLERQFTEEVKKELEA